MRVYYLEEGQRLRPQNKTLPTIGRITLKMLNLGKSLSCEPHLYAKGRPGQMCQAMFFATVLD